MIKLRSRRLNRPVFPHLNAYRHLVAAFAGSALALATLVILSMIIAPGQARNTGAVVRDTVVLDLVAWPAPAVPATVESVPVPAQAPVETATPPAVKPAPPKARPKVSRSKPKKAKRTSRATRKAKPAPPKTAKSVPQDLPKLTEPSPGSRRSSELTPTPAPSNAAGVSSPNPTTDSLTPVPIFLLTALPRFIRQAQPLYPAAMRSLAREGLVELDVLIDATGQVREVTIISSTGPEFSQAAEAAIRSSTFAPGEVDGKAVTTVLRLPISFRLK